MKKIPTLFKRDMSKQPALVIPGVNPGCEWVLAGEGEATRKFDGTCVLVENGKLYKRYELRVGKNAPEGFVQVDFDEVTQKGVGWVPVGDGPEDKWHREAGRYPTASDGTYELCGPKVQGNPEKLTDHRFITHGAWPLHGAPRDYETLRDYLKDRDIEGIVWWHPDGRMAKIKKKDFGFKR